MNLSLPMLPNPSKKADNPRDNDTEGLLNPDLLEEDFELSRDLENIPV